MSMQSEEFFDNQEKQDYVTVYVGDQLFGIPVLQVHDILRTQFITRVPLSPIEIGGSLNLRGRIVTAIDMRRRLGLPIEPEVEGVTPRKLMNVVVESKNELYSLLVDRVGEVLSLPESKYEKNPPTLDEKWKEIASGIYRLDGVLLIVMNVKAILDFSKKLVA